MQEAPTALDQELSQEERHPGETFEPFKNLPDLSPLSKKDTYPKTVFSHTFTFKGAQIKIRLETSPFSEKDAHDRRVTIMNPLGPAMFVEADTVGTAKWEQIPLIISILVEKPEIDDSNHYLDPAFEEDRQAIEQAKLDKEAKIAQAKALEKYSIELNLAGSTYYLRCDGNQTTDEMLQKFAAPATDELRDILGRQRDVLLPYKTHPLRQITATIVEKELPLRKAGLRP